MLGRGINPEAFSPPLDDETTTSRSSRLGIPYSSSGSIYPTLVPIQRRLQYSFSDLSGCHVLQELWGPPEVDDDTGPIKVAAYPSYPAAITPAALVLVSNDEQTHSSAEAETMSFIMRRLLRLP